MGIFIDVVECDGGRLVITRADDELEYTRY